MKRAPFLIPVILIMLVSCGKSKFTTKPQITIKSINSVVEPGGELDAIIDYTSKKGDLGQGTFVAIRQRLNQIPLPPNTGNTDTVSGPIPDFPDQSMAEFEFKLDWATYLHESDTENDTIVFKFAAVDRSGNSSDTITSPQIVVKFQ
jgi:hypothetical protein